VWPNRRDALIAYRHIVTAARVLVVEDHPVFRMGMARMLELESWVGAVLEAGTVEEAVRAAVVEGADVVVMDLALPDGDGLAATRRIRQVRPDARVLVLTADEEPHTVAAALDAGAAGYLLKRTDPDDVTAALRTVWRGGTVLGPAVDPGVLARRSGSGAPAPFDALSERELDVVCMQASGLPARAIARHLDLAEHTVRNGMRPIYDKLGVADRAEAMWLARSAGLGWPRT
jgi:two-component system, NarL family, nitrate/nitrite response regulator NarL